MSIHKTRFITSSKKSLLLFATVIGAVLLPSNTSLGFVVAGVSPTTSPPLSNNDRNPRQHYCHARSPKLDLPIRHSVAADKNELDRITAPSVVEKRILLAWFHGVIGFVVWNYYTTTGLWPSFFLDIPVRVWSLLHALSAMVFAGGIITTTLLEWQLPTLNFNGPAKDDKSMILQWLWQVESKLVLPAVSMSLISGVVQAFDNYTSLRFSPPHVKGALHVMALFAIWWAWTDRRSQAGLREDGFDETKVTARRLSNLVSCAFLFVLYGLMILKPGF